MNIIDWARRDMERPLWRSRVALAGALTSIMLGLLILLTVRGL
jgi:hypothetical protein